MVGMVVREEVDFAAGPFMLSPARAAATDYTLAVWTGDLRMVSGLRGLKIDPWGFLLPLSPLVWVVTMTALVGMLAVLQVLHFYHPSRSLLRCANTFSSVRVLLQQDMVWPGQWWWWERLVLGLWMLTTLVLTKSYAGNLMSLLAVRYVPQPFQTPRDVLDDPHVAMIWQKYSRNEYFLRTVESGVFREVAELEEKDRLKFVTQAQLPESLDTLVRAGHHVLVDNGNAVRNLIALDFSQKGFNPRVMSLTESGLLKYWAQDVPNFTRCNNVPKTVAFSTTLSFSNLWGVFVLLAGGLTAGLMVWCLELLTRLTKKSY
ncbi:glutamate receptor 3.3-like [Portunus trituberculatus]|uniref:glutamate receptor 3.3-like n=1 Tax=Portunus trituberculatus TaxID=210409 RepID=UPI001E1CCEE0|nr:glutamate receptor 3.3-like [Portunus trituberculatus]